MSSVTPYDFYELDREVFRLLKKGAKSKDQIEKWKGVASGIAEYVSSWGIVRFWAMSRSPKLLHGEIPSADQEDDDQRRYFAWGVARIVLCEIVGNDLNLRDDMTTDEFLTRFEEMELEERVLLVDLLIEIADTIQFWTMRFDDAIDSQADP